MSVVLASGLVAGLMLAAPTIASADPSGTWLRPSTGGKIQAFKCGGGLGLRVTASKTKAHVGKRIMCGAKKTGANRYEGSIRNLEDGKTYSGKVVIKGRKMDLSGCVLGGLVCKTDTWRKIN
ncbi:MAG: DUF2147 domain-containing protein [Pseudomonadota bacterium]